MIPNAIPHEVTSRGVTASASFGISRDDEAALMTILRDTLYTDRILAIMREYSSNAWDAHRSVGKYLVPIEVHLPTLDDPVLRIRDFGPGLSRDEVFTIYTQYGASTKRKDDESVGCMGIGSKSGFSYSDTFVVTSWKNGSKCTYVAVLDKSERGVINLLRDEPCDEASGVEIEVPVKADDIEAFRDRAENLYRHFMPRPRINLVLPDIEGVQLDHGILDTAHSQHRWVAVMGCVPYVINLNHITTTHPVRRVSGTLFFDIGEVEITASREELKYSEATKAKVAERIDGLFEDFVMYALALVDSQEVSNWEKRLQFREMLSLGIDAIGKGAEMGETSFKLADPAFDVSHHGSPATYVSIDRGTRLVIRDTGLKLDGYNLEHAAYVISPVGGVVAGILPSEVASARAALDAKLLECRADGIPIAYISTYQWVKPYKPGRRSGPPKPKHKVRNFVLMASSCFSKPYSDNWAIEDRVPTDEDIFVILSGFQPVHGVDYRMLREDRALAYHFRVGMPTIYGYKTTEKKRVYPERVKGTHYADWSKTFVRSLLTPEVLALLDLIRWRPDRGGNGYGESERTVVQQVVGKLGPTHPVSAFLQHQDRAHAGLVSLPPHRSETLMYEGLSRRLPGDAEKSLVLEDIFEKYPLLDVPTSGWRDRREDLHVLLNDRAEHYLHYIQLIDKENA